ncbi:peptidoglycan DD-metalloendopeptidase family protein [Sinorhizobium sp. BG8]|uniref:peptidoglycan DD-metalloendopeptidase family protein n=1 Tax=Sinorhizobium sp. BG8 TaxID=2613773 RepID=UPI00193EA2F3|nr:peptidoglycan DD-metalloendopeptidase family protein [Sinorhizobium sp. BG8]QRM55373.1 peptidoglycan DD-metalloendopeptidase family protein [Sinorhizobium sp. BG8]
MRQSVSASYGKTAVRLIAAALLASVATGCSSDATRFSGLFSRSDDVTTGSIPRRTLFGGGAVPRGDVGQGQIMPAESVAGGNQSYGQPASNGGVSYEPINTATNAGSGTRYATTPMNVQRTSLAEPAVASRNAEQDVALAQPMPAARKKSETLSVDSDPVTTGTVKPGKAGWSTANAPVVMLRQGEDVATLSRRYGVPEKEILKANGLKRSTDAEPGQKVVIPTFGTTASAAKASTDTTLGTQGKLPTPDNKSGDAVAILPAGTSNREKSSQNGAATSSKLANAGEGEGNTPGAGNYEVQPGDSLAKIARKTGVSVDALRKANGLETASIRIGQKLKVPAGGGAATDQTVTASVPEAKKAVESAEKPVAYQPPVKTVSVSEATAKSDVTDDAPESTGIGKYRWPVRGAVIAGYGANVDGNRNDGIDISVPEGTPIKAAENGVVIYSGSSLKELGNAVLVRHDDGTVTVYGHTGDINVQRGQKVQRGQTLASSGMSGNATRPKVHFEVRKNATPVNPMTFLE